MAKTKNIDKFDILKGALLVLGSVLFVYLFPRSSTLGKSVMAGIGAVIGFGVAFAIEKAVKSRK